MKTKKTGKIKVVNVRITLTTFIINPNCQHKALALCLMLHPELSYIKALVLCINY